jgi:hypothetical protein
MSASRSIGAYLLEILRHPRAITLRRSSRALGDNLLLSCLAREIKRNCPDRYVILETEWPELFVGNPYVDAVFAGKVAPFYHKLKYRIVPETREHLIDQLVRQLPVPVTTWERKVDLFLPEESLARNVQGLPDRFVAVNPAGKSAHSENRKDWGFENFAALRGTVGGIPFVQIGDAGTPLLPQAIDQRGRPILESAFIVSRSTTGVFLEGGLMHVANAVNKPSVIIYGGAIHPGVSGYGMHLNLHTEPDCGPCFTSDEPLTMCDSMICMREIEVARVAGAVQDLLDRNEERTEEKPLES